MSETDAKAASQQRRNILEAIIYFATLPSDGGRVNPLPSDAKLIYHALSRSVVEYVRGKEIEYKHKPYMDLPDGEKNWDPGNDYFEENLWTHLVQECGVEEGQLHAGLEQHLRQLLDPQGTAAMNGERDKYKSELHMHVLGNGTKGICEGANTYAFQLTPEFFDKVQHDILPKIAPEMKQDVEALGQYMRRYINKDIAGARTAKYPWSL